MSLTVILQWNDASNTSGNCVGWLFEYWKKVHWASPWCIPFRSLSKEKWVDHLEGEGEIWRPDCDGVHKEHILKIDAEAGRKMCDWCKIGKKTTHICGPQMNNSQAWQEHVQSHKCLLNSNTVKVPFFSLFTCLQCIIFSMTFKFNLLQWTKHVYCCWQGSLEFGIQYFAYR